MAARSPVTSRGRFRAVVAERRGEDVEDADRHARTAAQGLAGCQHGTAGGAGDEGPGAEVARIGTDLVDDASGRGDRIDGTGGDELLGTLVAGDHALFGLRGRGEDDDEEEGRAGGAETDVHDGWFSRDGLSWAGARARAVCPRGTHCAAKRIIDSKLRDFHHKLRK